MPERTAGRIPGAGGALFLKRRTPFGERLGRGIAGAAQTIGGGLMQRAQQQQVQQQRLQEQGTERLTELLPQIGELVADRKLTPEAARALFESASSVSGIEDATPPDFGLFKRPEPTAREQLAPILPDVLQGQITPEMIEAAAPLLGVAPGAPTGFPPQSTEGAGAALTPLPGLEGALGPSAGLPPAPPGVGPRRPDPTVQQFQELATRARAAQPTPEPDQFTLSPGQRRFAGEDMIAEGAPEPEKPQERYKIIGGTLFDMQTMQPVFTSPSAPRGPGPRRVVEEEGKQLLIDENGNVIAEFGAKPERQGILEELRQLGGVTPQPSHTPEEPRFLDRIGSALFGGGRETSQAPAAGDGAAEQLLRSQGVPVTPKNLEVAREQLRRRSGGAQRGTSPQVGSIVTLRDGTRGRVVAIRPDGRLEVEPAPSPDTARVVTQAELQAIAARRGTTVEQERQRASAAGFTVR